jgi:hypothetical protein
MLGFGAVIGFVLGAVGLSAVVTITHMLIAPELLGDGQYPLLWVVYTGPPGGVLGAATGAAVALRGSDRTVAAAKVCVVVGGVMGILYFLLTILALRSILFDSANWQERWAAFRGALPLCAYPLWWAIAMFRKGWAM